MRKVRANLPSSIERGPAGCSGDRMSGQHANASGWYLIQCKPRQDERAEQNLRNQSFNCYRPLRRAQQVKRGRQVEVSESLFPGYLFVRLCLSGWIACRITGTPSVPPEVLLAL